MTSYWKIDVASWGTLWARGTEEQAEEWRVHKARWEGCVARKHEVAEADLPDGEEWELLDDLIGGATDD